MTVSLKYVSSPVAVTLQSYYSAASSGFATWAGAGDGTQPSSTPGVQEIPLQASPWNVYDENAETWLPSWIAAFTGDALLSQIAINATLVPPAGSVPGTVVPPESAPVSISINPKSASIAAGLTQQYVAIGTYGDGSVRDITGVVTWASSAAHVTINAAGLATGATAGAANITATLLGVSDQATLTVTAATLVSIVVNPTNPSVALGLTEQFTATGTYTDSTTQDLTSSVTWAALTPSHATINSAGLATTVAVGTSLIRATLGVAGHTTLTVTAAALVSIAVTPPTATLAPLATQQYTATGTFTDSTTANITSTATWASDNHPAATIAAGGLATAVADGVANITATKTAITSPAVVLTVAG